MHSSARDAKRQGELAELVFAVRAARMGWQVSKPYGESSAYDFVVDVGGKLQRVQVKSVSVERGGTYRISGGCGGSSRHAYTEDEIDVLAAYVIPQDAWYLIPVEYCGMKSIHLCPHRRSRRKFEQFREAWHVIGGRDRGHGAKTEDSEVGLQDSGPTRDASDDWECGALAGSVVAALSSQAQEHCLTQ